MNLVKLPPELEQYTQVSRKSPGIFGYFNFFQSWKFIIFLFFGLPIGAGLGVTLFNWFITNQLNWNYFVRDSLTFLTITLSGTLATSFFRQRSPLLNIRMAYLINAYGTGMWLISYMLGHFLVWILQGQESFIEIFFILGGLISYIVLFVVYFSFTNVKPPWYIFLALIQPVVGILIYSFYTVQVSIIFFLKAIVFFMGSAFIFALLYGPAMAFVSITYRRSTGVGGYNFIRAFIEVLLTDISEDRIEKYFEPNGEERDLILQYMAFRDRASKQIKGLFIVPNVHFGPFKTCGSSALADNIYKSFEDIEGITVFHTTVTHAQNFTNHSQNNRVIDQIKFDMQNLKFESPKSTKFVRLSVDHAKLLGINLNHIPFLMYTMHPFPTDDIRPEVGQRIQELSNKHGIAKPLIIDCHNSLIGDEILIKEESPEAKEMYQITELFYQQLKDKKEAEHTEILYGVAKDLVKEYPINAGIGAGGITVHLFKIHDQETAIIHIDGNNAVTSVRSAIVNLGENMGLDRVELSTSDTHTVVRIISSQGYYPLGTKIPEIFLVEKIRNLILKARTNYSCVDVAIHQSITPGFRFWKDISYFDIIMETIERCLVVSKLLLTVGLLLPILITLIITLFYF